MANLTKGIADALASYLAAKSAAQKDATDKAFQQQNTEAGFYAGTRQEDLNRAISAAELSQQNPFTQFNALQKENQKMDLASGQDVGPRFRTASVIPGLEKFGEIPQLGFNFGSNFKAAQTPQNLAREYANSQIRQKQVFPDTPVSSMGEIFGGSVGTPLDNDISSAATAARNKQELSKSSQLEAIRRAVEVGSAGKDAGAGGAVGSALLGALGALGGGKNEAGGNLGPIGNALKELYYKAKGYTKVNPNEPQRQEQAPWDPSGASEGGSGMVEGNWWETQDPNLVYADQLTPEELDTLFNMMYPNGDSGYNLDTLPPGWSNQDQYGWW